MIRVSSKIRSPLHAGQARMARSSSSIMASSPPALGQFVSPLASNPFHRSPGPAEEPSLLAALTLEEVQRPGQPVSKRDAGRPAETLLRQRGAQAASPLLTGLRGAVLRRHLEARRAGQRAMELVHRSLDPRTDVHAADDLGALESAEVGGRDVLDVDVVAGLLAVPVDDRRLPLQEALGEDGDDAGLALGILAGAVDVGVAERDTADAEEGTPRAHVHLH